MEEGTEGDEGIMLCLEVLCDGTIAGTYRLVPRWESAPSQPASGDAAATSADATASLPPSEDKGWPLEPSLPDVDKLRLGPSWDWESSPPQPAAAVASADATVSLPASADAVASLPSGSVDKLVLKVARHSECIVSIPLIKSTRKERSIELGSHLGSCYINVEILPPENRAILRLYELAQGSDAQWRSTVLYSVHTSHDNDNQYGWLEKNFGKNSVYFHGKQCANISFPPMKINFKNAFKCKKLIGKGTEGMVYRCSPRFGSQFTCAVKAIDMGNLWVVDPNVSQGAFILLLNLICLFDVSILSLLNHSNVIDLYFAWSEAKQSTIPGRATGFVFVCMKHCPRSLEKYLDTGFEFNLKTCNHIFKQIIEALAFIHKHAVVHRDIKPGNILIEEDLTIKIIDFGIAKVKQHPHEGFAAGVYGSLPYSAPEIINCYEKHDEKVDIFSAGMIYCELFMTCVSERERKLNHLSKIMRQGMKECADLCLEFDLEGVPTVTDILNGWRGDLAVLKRLTRPDGTDRPSATEIMDLLHMTGDEYDKDS